MLLHEAASARADFTKESLEGSRARIGDLPDLSRLLPAAGSTQALLDSLALSALTTPAQHLAPFGIAEAVPQARRLDLHLTHPDAFVPFLDLLPSRSRDKTIHGVPGLRAQPAGRGSIDVWFDGKQDEALLNMGCRGVDMAPLLRDHQTAVTGAGRRPLWTQSIPPRPARGGRRRAYSRAADDSPPTITQCHNTSRYLASELLRRPGLWERLAGHQTLTVTGEESDHGLDWHVHRGVGPETNLHDDRLLAALEDRLAGPGFVMGRASHECLPDACRMRFFPRPHDDGWDGVLTVTTTGNVSANPVPVPRRARPFTVLSETQTAHGPTINSSAPRRPQTAGHVLQLEAAPMAFDRHTPWQFARHLGATWALNGKQVLIITSPPRKTFGRYRDPFTNWPRAERPEAPTQALWQPMRLVPGPGGLYVNHDGNAWPALEELVSRARKHFDWILLADNTTNDHICPEFLEGVADDYLLVSGDSGFHTTVTVSHPRHSPSPGEGIPLTPAEAAVLWRERVLRFVPVEKIPVTGLLLAADQHDTEHRHPEFAAEADRALARLGTPVLGRFAARSIRDGRTVLDQERERADSALCAEAQAVAERVLTTGTLPARRFQDGRTSPRI